MATGTRRLLVLAILVALVLSVLMSACTSNQDTTSPLVSDNQATNSPPPFQAPPIPERPKHWHNDLDSTSNKLVDAQKRGEAESFAQKADIELVDGSVKVTIECVPGQFDAAIEVATKAGDKLGLSYKNYLDAFVPITSLIELADADSIRLIRLPIRGVPAASD